MSEDVRRLWSTSAPRRGRADIFRSAVFKKTNSLQRLMSARGLRGADRRGHADLQTKNKHYLSFVFFFQIVYHE